MVQYSSINYCKLACFLTMLNKAITFFFPNHHLSRALSKNSYWTSNFISHQIADYANAHTLGEKSCFEKRFCKIKRKKKGAKKDNYHYLLIIILFVSSNHSINPLDVLFAHVLYLFHPSRYIFSRLCLFGSTMGQAFFST